MPTNATIESVPHIASPLHFLVIRMSLTVRCWASRADPERNCAYFARMDHQDC
jgi:hypothetical protein